MTHCRGAADHWSAGSSLLPPSRCKRRDDYLPLHPMLYAVDDDPPPPPLSV